MSTKVARDGLVTLIVALAPACGWIAETLDRRGTLIAKAELTQPGTAQARFVVGSTKLTLWASLRGKHRSNRGRKNQTMPITYDVDVVAQGNPAIRILCDARATTMAVCGSETNLFGELEADCEVKLPCELPPLAAGEVVLRVTGKPSEPERIILIRDMSLLVREEKK